MKKSVIIPIAYQTVVDDVGWFCGSDDRHLGMPSRTGMPRDHVAEDWTVINEIGKRIDQKIVGAMVIGEWDKLDRLRGKPHMTPHPYEWRRSESINIREAERCAAAIESSEYVEIALHGLLHSYWDEELGHDDQQYYIRPRGGYAGTERLIPVSDEYFEDCIDTFLDIYADWGFSKKIVSFISPGSAYGPVEGSLGFARILKARGFKYWANYWSVIKDSCRVIDGLTFINKGTGFVPWNAYDVNPALLPDYSLAENDGVIMPKGTVLGLHWPNFLRFDPKKNRETVDAWVEFYRRQAEIFGVMISRDIGFASRQALYERFTRVDFTENEVVLDFSAVDESGATDIGNTMYVSIRKRLAPVSAEGARVTLYETHERFRTYKVERQGKTAKIKIK